MAELCDVAFWHLLRRLRWAFSCPILGLYKGYLGILGFYRLYRELYREYIRIMQKKMEATFYSCQAFAALSLHLCANPLTVLANLQTLTLILRSLILALTLNRLSESTWYPTLLYRAPLKKGRELRWQNPT